MCTPDYMLETPCSFIDAYKGEKHLGGNGIFQEMGNYKMAHQQLLGFCKVLQAQKRCVPLELSKQLMLLHSYILVKTLIRLGDHRYRETN